MDGVELKNPTPNTDDWKIEKGIHKFSIVFLAIITFFSLSYLMFFLATSTNELSKSKTSSQYENSELSDWKTYRNEEYGFELKIPNDWKVDDSTFSDNDLFLIMSPETEKARLDCYEGPNCEPNISIQISKPSSEQNYLLNQSEKISIGGHDAYQTYQDDGFEGLDMVVLVQDTSNLYYMTFYKVKINEFQNSTESKILSTFKFI